MTKIITNPVNSQATSAEIGIMPKIGGIAIDGTPITADVEFSQIVFMWRVGDPTAGKTLILEGADGNPVFYFNLATGEQFIFPTKKIIYQSGIYTTDVILLTWYGGQ